MLLVSLLLLLGAIPPAQAQNESNNWIFGNQAWLKFPGGSATPVLLSGAVINQGEGSASISDQAGNLLFSTDGRSVWNSSNVQMPNGSGLLGASSATQSALIVPWPETQCRKYFIFTVDDTADHKPQRLNYSVVDMNATTGGGLGDVTTKNTFLKKWVSEKLAAVRDSSGTGFWVVAHGFKQPSDADPNPQENREFYAYHVTAAGVSPPVVSTIGSAHQNSGSPLNPANPSTGQMKISSDGSLIACAVTTAFVEILHFNSAPNGGQVTGPVTTFPASSTPFQDPSVYGLEFSPSSGFLYVTTITAPSRLFQYDLTSQAWTLLATGTAAPASYDIGQLQLGPDTRIYVARDTQHFISVINSPESAGTSCAFVANGPSLSPWKSTAGLPAMIGGQFSCAAGPSVTPSPVPTSTPTPSPTPTPTPTVTPPVDPCCPPWNSVIWAVVVVFSLLLFRAPITRFLGR